MESVQIILAAIFILSPIGFFIYAVDYKIKPLLKRTRHDLLYITAVETLILLYALCIGFVFKKLRMDNIMSVAVFGIYMSMLLLTFYTACITLLWWTVFYIKKLIKQ